MRKVAAIFFILGLSSIVSCSKRGPVAEGKSVLKEISRVNVEAADKINSAKNEQEAADAILKYSKETVKLTEKAKAIEAKYADFRIAANKDLEAEAAAVQESFTKFHDSLTRLTSRFPKSTVIMDALRKHAQESYKSGNRQ